MARNAIIFWKLIFSPEFIDIVRRIKMNVALYSLACNDCRLTGCRFNREHQDTTNPILCLGSLHPSYTKCKERRVQHLTFNLYLIIPSYLYIMFLLHHDGRVIARSIVMTQGKEYISSRSVCVVQ